MYDELVKLIRHCATDPMHCLSCGEDKDGRCFKRLMTQAADAIEKMPRWIPVTERLPREQETVLTWGKQGVILLDWRHDNKWCCFGDVTHWLPLPEPPKEEE